MSGRSLSSLRASGLATAFQVGTQIKAAAGRQKAIDTWLNDFYLSSNPYVFATLYTEPIMDFLKMLELQEFLLSLNFSKILFKSDMNKKFCKPIKFFISTTVLTLTTIGINSAHAALIGNPIKLSEGTGYASDPSLAYNSIEQEYIAVWAYIESSQQVLVSQRFSTTGSLIEGNINLSRRYLGSQFQPVIAYNSTDNQYLVSFQVQGDPIFPYNNSVGQLLTADSKFIGDNFLISSAGQEISLLYNPEVNQYFQTARAFEPANRILGQRIKSDGTLINSNIRLDASGDSAPNGQVALDSVNNQYLATWREQGSSPKFTVQGRFINADGRLISEQLEIVPPPDFKSGATPLSPIRTIFNPISKQFLIIYRNFEYPQIRGRFLDKSGTIIGSEIIVSSNVSYEFLSVAFNETLQTYLLAWINESGLVGQFIGTSGNLISDPFTIASEGNQIYDFSIVPNNDSAEFVIAWQTQGSQKGQAGIFAQRINTSSSSIPEPSTILGIGIILAALPVLKNKYAMRNKKALAKV
ncbi:hypothetical protein [Nostoc sp. DedQUE09]|uniref:hypothetical protein n=1 Tax=Nostoc sp. DedQUE09 TaxID=3075394 RepID=UPI002AD5582C|nr:hypothetical protein [Nostoc sp. DedQUE09]MDZ7950452.1 hypothetical protein [Nostoc sp. DedQUE09]